MPGERIIEVAGVGPVLCRKHARARRITVHVSASNGVWVTLPLRGSFASAAAAAARHREWIARNRARIEQAREKASLPGGVSTLPDKAGAKAALTARLEDLAREYGFEYERVTVREQATRWGSCSSKNRISLNIRLVLLPDRLRDYVILHELVHTRVHNHGPEFHAVLEKHVKDHRRLSRELRKTGMFLLPPQ